MPAKPSSREFPLPRGWPSRVRSAILHVISLGQFTLAYTRGWAANSPNSRIRLKAELDRTHQEITLLREEVRIKVGVHGVTGDRHGGAKRKEKQGQRERRQASDGDSEGGGVPQR